mmetsp:Transcript_16629/g.23427  ORF Transcript_16629/g.23427 Transcript_16629/m.23427 type:complete len:178 (+) Transcript_16629:211-744(+)
MSNTSSPPEQESLLDHIKRSLKNCMASCFACAGTTKETAVIKKLEYDIAARKKLFGTEYMTLDENNATPEELEACHQKAKDDIEELKKQIQKHEEDIAKTNEERDRAIQENNAKSPKASTSSTTAAAAAQSSTTKPTETTTTATSAATTTKPETTTAAPEPTTETSQEQPKVEAVDK